MESIVSTDLERPIVCYGVLDHSNQPGSTPAVLEKSVLQSQVALRVAKGVQMSQIRNLQRRRGRNTGVFGARRGSPGGILPPCFQRYFLVCVTKRRYSANYILPTVPLPPHVLGTSFKLIHVPRRELYFNTQEAESSQRRKTIKRLS